MSAKCSNPEGKSPGAEHSFDKNFKIAAVLSLIAFISILSVFEFKLVYDGYPAMIAVVLFFIIVLIALICSIISLRNYNNSDEHCRLRFLGDITLIVINSIGLLYSGFVAFVFIVITTGLMVW